MKLSEAIQALKEGKKLRAESSSCRKFIYLKDGLVYDDEDELYEFMYFLPSYFTYKTSAALDPQIEYEIYEEPIQLLNAIEALEALKDGKKIITNGIDFNDMHFSYIELDENGDITSPHTGAISNGCVDLTDLYEKKFLVYEPEEDIKEEYSLDDAFKDLRELYNHPFCASTINGNMQYLFSFTTSGDAKIIIANYSSERMKLTEISPIFNSALDAACAFKDFGEQRLLKMFKRLKGIE